MAKKKSKAQASANKSTSSSKIPKAQKNDTCKNIGEDKPSLLLFIIGAVGLLLTLVFPNSISVFKFNFLREFILQNDGVLQNGERHQNRGNPKRRREEVKSLFLKWFTDNGGQFHPISIKRNVDSGESNEVLNLNVTLEEFPSFGGWGLALPVPQSLLPWKKNECQPSEEGDNDQCTPTINSSMSTLPSEKEMPSIIHHLDPLFTIPSSIIISVQSVLDTYAFQSSPLYLSNFYSNVNRILNMAFPGDPGGLDRHTQGGIMDLVEQDVLIAMYLMAEDCHHRHASAFRNDSHWGPYLDVLPQYQIPRLDTFDDEAYAVLNDENLEFMGRKSKQLLEQIYQRGSDTTVGNLEFREGSLKAVIRDMILEKIKKSTSTGSVASPGIPDSCLRFETFHAFVSVVSSRAMVLKGRKYLTPLAEMINYSPKPVMQGSEGNLHQNESNGERQRWIPAPFDLYHTLAEDKSITVRSDRDVFVTKSAIDHFGLGEGDGIIQLFEDYGPVDSSLFLEAHGFVPTNNPHHCAVLLGSLFVPESFPSFTSDVKSHRYDLTLKALKHLHLIHPNTERFEKLEDVCVRADLTIVEDGRSIGQRPASDSIAVAALMLGDSNEVWNLVEENFDVSLSELRQKCEAAVDSADLELVQLHCARYPGNRYVVKGMLRRPSKKAESNLEGRHEKYNKIDTIKAQLHEAESQGKEQLALAYRFRIQEMEILEIIAQSSEKMDTIQHIPAANVPGNQEELEEKVLLFKSFLASLDLPVNKIEPKVIGRGMRIGAFATEHINTGDIYLSVTSNSVIDSETALRDASSSALGKLLRKYTSKDGFDLLLYFLLHEYFILKDKSRWWAYLNLLPTLDEMASYHPLFFDEDEMDLYLKGSDVRKFIARYQRRASEKHAALASDLQAHLVLGSDILLDRTKFLWASAVLDSRSIWWNGERHLVPLLDLVNADGIGNVHETRLESSGLPNQKAEAVTPASRIVEKGDQIFENYGQPNYLLFTYHGFVLDKNPDDCALLEGLSMNRNDPGFKHAYHLRMQSPVFCIGDVKSVQQLAHFLRAKHGLSIQKEPKDEQTIDNEVRPYLVQVLKDRVDRLENTLYSQVEGERCRISRCAFMRQLVQSDLNNFQSALSRLL